MYLVYTKIWPYIFFSFINNIIFYSLRMDGVKVAHSPHMVGDLGSTPSPGKRKGCCLVFIIYMRFYTIYILYFILCNVLPVGVLR